MCPIWFRCVQQLQDKRESEILTKQGTKTQDTREDNHLLNTQSWNRYDDVQSTLLLVYQVKRLWEMKLNILTIHKPGVIT